jgi:hypothetical protein
MSTLAISNQGPLTSRNVENRGIGGENLHGFLLKFRNDLVVS